MNPLEQRTPAQAAKRICQWFFWCAVLPAAALFALIANKESSHREESSHEVVAAFFVTLLIGSFIFLPVVYLCVWGFQKSRLVWKKRTAVMNLENDPGNDHYFAQVAGELKSGELNQGVWAKSLAKAEGVESKAKAFYIRMRVAQLVEAKVQSAVELVKRTGATSNSKINAPEITTVPPPIPPTPASTKEPIAE